MTEPPLSLDADEGLAALGWGDWQRQALGHEALAGVVPARVVRREGTGLWVDTGRERAAAMLAGSVKHAVKSAAELPVVGDWVLLARPTEPPANVAWIRGLLPRQTALMRRRAGTRAEAQLLAANVDLALVVWALDRAPNVGLLQRAIVAASAGGIQPLIVLTKSDICEGGAKHAENVRGRLGFDVVSLSVVSGHGVTELEARLGAGRTAVLLGPSGAGKSSLVNRLMGVPSTRVGSVRLDDRKGQHTTTHRELFRLPRGALLLDGPGVRELGIAVDAGAIVLAFPEIPALAQRCAHRSCGHTIEHGCGVLRAVNDGSLDRRRLADYRSLVAEANGDAPPRRQRGRREGRGTRLRG